jgi:hypothetical protein
MKSKLEVFIEGLLHLRFIGSAVSIDAQHDVIYVNADGVGEDDALMGTLGAGWHWDNECDCWGFFT